MAALMMACPSCVTRQRRERGTLATRPRKCRRLTRRENLRAAPAICPGRAHERFSPFAPTTRLPGASTRPPPFPNDGAVGSLLEGGAATARGCCCGQDADPTDRLTREMGRDDIGPVAGTPNSLADPTREIALRQ